MGYEQEIRNAVETAFIDRRIESNLAYKPQLITNNSIEGKKVLSSIEDEILSCDSFLISVALITRGGIELLLQTLKELEKRQTQGKIPTTDYKVMTDPVVLRKLHNLKNI
jgi:HKD family nuclease